MRIAISGVQRSVGRFLCEKLLSENHEVVVVPNELLSDKLSLIALYEGCSCVINLVGEEAYECKDFDDVESLRDTQTKNIIEAFESSKKPPEIFICISSNVVTTKTKNIRLVSQWEKEVSDGERVGVRCVALATNVILGKNEVTSKIYEVFKGGFARVFKNSQAHFNWVHEDDICGAILWAINDKNVRGAYNLVAPDSIKNGELYQMFSKLFKRGSIMPLSAFYIKRVFKNSLYLFDIKRDLGHNGIGSCGYEFKHKELEKVLWELK